MNKILKTMKSGFNNIKEIVTVFLSDDPSNEGYDLYINDVELAQTAQILQSLESEQEQKRLSLFYKNYKKGNSKNNVKKNDLITPPELSTAIKLSKDDILEPEK